MPKDLLCPFCRQPVAVHQDKDHLDFSAMCENTSCNAYVEVIAETSEEVRQIWNQVPVDDGGESDVISTEPLHLPRTRAALTMAERMLRTGEPLNPDARATFERAWKELDGGGR